MSDVTERADEYEGRLNAASSTETLMGSLAKSVARNQRVTRWLILSVVLDVLFSIALGSLAYIAQHNASHANKNTMTIARNTDRITAVIRTQDQARYNICMFNVNTVRKVNDANAALIEIEKTTQYTTPLQQNLQNRRIAAYKAGIVLPLIVCDKP